MTVTYLLKMAMDIVRFPISKVDLSIAMLDYQRVYDYTARYLEKNKSL